MMDGSGVYLLASVLLNIVLFRWGVTEYGRRRKYQKQSGALADALKAINTRAETAVEQESGFLGWLAAALLLGTGLYLLWSVF